jgi:anti-sigma regulatory factor (Ser/Thr protein kinase)
MGSPSAMEREDLPPIATSSLQLASDQAAPGKAREWVGWLADHLSPERFDAALIMVSELVSNAVLHSGLPPGEPIHVSARADHQRVRVSVCDCGDGFAPDWPPSPPDPAVLGGRGLWLVHQLADHVLVDGARGRVAFELSRGA